MEIEQVSVEQQLLQHAERQTKALESLNTYFMRFLAVLTLIAVVGIIALINA